MLRVGLTGDLGSGKSTVAKMLAVRGAIVLSSDDMARAMMQPGEPVYAAIVKRFGPQVVSADGTLDRKKLARLAFDPAHPRVEELNAIIHPAVLSAQAQQLEQIARENPNAIVVIESALIFTTKAGDRPWHERFDCIVLVTAPEDQKIARFIERASQGRHLSSEERSALEADARQRLARQRITEEQTSQCLVIENKGSFAELEQQTDRVWRTLKSRAD